ncbi:MAG: tyrosine-type recombinase/integrase [Desulfobulbaceae bacterium]|nr:tyrosine-type recombinase/integrase [Desulfobulbaceae bacterium]
MKSSEVKRFAALYDRHLKLLKLQGKSKSTIDVYSRAVRRIKDLYDCCPDKLTKEQLENFFGDLIESHSWSTVKIDRLGLMFFWKHVLELDWQWLDMVKPPIVKSIPDILTPTEIERLICATKKLRYRVFLLATYSMGLRLTEALSLEVGDIDGDRKRIHVRRGKGHKDRMVPLPDRTLQALRILWSKHRHPTLIFPNARGSVKTIQQATTHMNIGGTQNAMKVVVRECKIKKKSPSIRFVIMPSSA